MASSRTRAVAAMERSSRLAMVKTRAVAAMGSSSPVAMDSSRHMDSRLAAMGSLHSRVDRTAHHLQDILVPALQPAPQEAILAALPLVALQRTHGCPKRTP